MKQEGRRNSSKMELPHGLTAGTNSGRREKRRKVRGCNEVGKRTHSWDRNRIRRY